MIIDLQKFVTNERPYWTELESTLNQIERAPERRMPLEQVRRFHYLYERATAALFRPGRTAQTSAQMIPKMAKIRRWWPTASDRSSMAA